MKLTIQTPALLFPALSFLLLTFTNRYITISSLARNLHKEWNEQRSRRIGLQIAALRRRIGIIRILQLAAVVAMLLSVFCMLSLQIEMQAAAEVFWVGALLALIVSLIASVFEVMLSASALDLQLGDALLDE